MELDKGMSSDTAVGDDFGLEMDSEDDEDQHFCWTSSYKVV